jgi:hypothetical protein
MKISFIAALCAAAMNSSAAYAAAAKPSDMPSNGIVRSANAGIATPNRDTSASLEPDTLMMLLTGLGVMGSIARRRHLARKST